MNLQEAFDAGFDAVKNYVERSFDAYEARLIEIEKRFDALPTPKDGKDADLNEVRSIISEALKPISEDVNAIEPAPGLPDIPKMIEDAIDARMGVDDMERSIEEIVRAVVAEIPIPKDGLDGKPGEKGEKGDPGQDGAPGRDGVDVKDLFRGEGGVLVATMSDGRVKELGQFVGKDGEPGKDGADGLGFDDLSFEYDGEKTITLRFTKGDQVKEFPVVMPVVIDRGVFSEGKAYSPGDGVTWGGSFWIAQEETCEKPDSAKGWRLAVKKGRDGKDGKAEPAAKSGPIRVTIPKAGE